MDLPEQAEVTAMPREHVELVFRFDELSEAAQEKAVEVVAGKLGGEWWDLDDNDSVSESILFKLAEVFKSPGWDKYGPGDFPGIDGVELITWDLDRGQYLVLRGCLDRVNAPGLPWSDRVGDCLLRDERFGGTVVGVEEGDVDLPADEQRQACVNFAEVVRDALHEAWKSGAAQMEYMTSEESAREWIAANDPEFYEEGSLFSL